MLVQSLIITTVFIASSVARASSSPPSITIPQSGQSSVEFGFGRCGADVAEIVAHMRAHPDDFDPHRVSVLMLSNVVVGKEWALHVVVYDGRGYVYDPSFGGSRTAAPMRLWPYLSAVSRARERTEIRVIAPDDWIARHSENSVRAFEIFGAGLNAMKGYWRYVVSEAEWRALGPVETIFTLEASMAYFGPPSPTDLILNWRTLFPRRREYLASWRISTPGRLMQLVRRYRGSLNDAVAAAAWVNNGPDFTRRYFELILKHEAELSRNPGSHFTLDALFKGALSESVWRDHPLRARLRADCIERLTGNESRNPTLG